MTITADGLYGLNFSGADGQVSINFNISIAPDMSRTLGNFLDLAITLMLTGPRRGSSRQMMC